MKMSTSLTLSHLILKYFSLLPACSYNFGCGGAHGTNFGYIGSTTGCVGSAKYVVEHMPNSVRMVFSLEGGDMQTGSRFNEGCGFGPVKDSYQVTAVCTPFCEMATLA